MQPELASEPFHLPGWVYEEKYDGWRIVAYKDLRSLPWHFIRDWF